MRTVQLLTTAILLFCLAGCRSSVSSPATAPTAPNEAPSVLLEDDLDLFEEEFAEDQGPQVPDPLEPLNRLMFGFNDVVYRGLLGPVANLYCALVARPVRQSVDRFFENLSTPVRWANCLLQGKTRAADTELRRFVINTTQGWLGLADPARQRCGLESSDEDLGQTLAVWGWSEGCYLVLPLLGPTTLRDGLGRLGDRFAEPTQYVEPWEAYLAVSATDFINGYSFRKDEYDQLTREALDPYTALRDVYLQWRRRQIEQ